MSPWGCPVLVAVSPAVVDDLFLFFFFPLFFLPLSFLFQSGGDRAGIHQMLHGVVCAIAAGWGAPSTRWVPLQPWPGASCDFWLLDPTSITEKSSNLLRT